MQDSPQNDGPPAHRYIMVLMLLSAVFINPSARASEAPSDVQWVQSMGVKAPVSVRLDVADDEPLIPGLQARSVKVIVRNDSEDRVIAVRGAHWWEGGVESLNWYGPLPGTTSQRRGAQSQPQGSGIIVDIESLIEKDKDKDRAKPDPQVISYNRTAAAMTSLAFERGVLLPGEQIAIPLPFTPQRYPNNTVQIEYVSVGGGDADWRGLVLVPDPDSQPGGEVLVAPDDDITQVRGRGTLGLLRPTMRVGEQGLEIQNANFEVPIPTADGYDIGLTGGLTRKQAAGRAGATIEEMNHMGYYLPAMKTWFFIGADGDTRTLRLEDGQWVFDFALHMPAFAPELFGRGDRKTSLLLNPDVFGHMVDVNTPSQDRYYDPGLTDLDADQLWEVLKYGRGKLAVELDAVVISPNGIKKQWVLTLAVKVDASGRWEHPNPNATQPATAPASTD
jgi:hypothetical protein